MVNIKANPREVGDSSEELILENIPYKPFGSMSITNRRIIGKNLIRLGRVAFEGEILLGDLVNVAYLPGVPVIGVPGLEFEYKSPDGGTAKATIHFASISARLGFKLRTGYGPKRIYDLILALSIEAKDKGN